MTQPAIVNYHEGLANYIKKVAIVGAGGHIGKAIAEKLLETGKHSVTAITRAGKNSILPDGITKALVDYNDQESLVSALNEQEFLIITLSLNAAPDTHTKLVNAAAKAGVSYVMPNAYSIWAHNEAIQRDIPITKQVLENIAEVQRAGLISITLMNGFWYEWSLTAGPSTFGFDLENRTVTLYDDGKKAINISTWAQCGRAVASLLSQKIRPEDENDRSTTITQWHNKTLLVSSFKISQRDILDSVKRATQTTAKDWKIEYEATEERYKVGAEQLQQGDPSGFLKMMYSRVFYPSGDGDFEPHNNLLGLPSEDLDAATCAALTM
ncbi:isoflavone reductase family protein [Colletotrichum incanum]|uniref:Isoflavone reductase family protein n=1 Tax=Colletotrichum incanum TaxID=1573173 RepID=A0A161WHZ9_COLIC|nr:isoflavone reductase family protein [Colletotrichum incanum]